MSALELATGGAAPDSETLEPTPYALADQEELRLEIGESPVEVTLLDGTCEVFGTEIVKDMVYKLQDTKIAFFTFHGCRLGVLGKPMSAYVSSECPNEAYANTHAELEKMRRNAARAFPTVTLPAPPLPKFEENDDALSDDASAAVKSEGSAPAPAPALAAAAEDAPWVTVPSRDSAGPRVLVVGVAGVGKTTLVRTLCSYAVRSGWLPLAVDLDVGDNMLSIPGTLTATAVEQPVGCEGGLARMSLRAPLVFYYGHTSVAENAPLWRRQVSRLARAVDARIGDGYTHAAAELAAQQKHYLATEAEGGATASAAAKAAVRAAAELAALTVDALPRMSPLPLSTDQRRVRASGAVINMPSVGDGVDVDAIAHVTRAFRVDVVLVLDNERLSAQLRQDPAFADLAIAQLPKSGGVVAPDAAAREALRARSLREYFYGVSGDFAPHLAAFPTAQVSVFSTAPTISIPLSALPMGMTLSEAVGGQDRLQPVSLGPEHANSILAITAAASSAEAAEAQVFGFLHVKLVENKIVRCLVPTQGTLPGFGRLLLGSLTWFE
jgi:polyribonucleotide 5'-hydroxyl-kinase